MKTINSLELATMLSRTHGEVLKMIKGTSGKKGAIENLQVQGIQNIEDYFIESNYKSKLLCYEVSEEGCKILASKIGHSRRNPELTKESFLDSCANYFNKAKLKEQQIDMNTNNECDLPTIIFDNEEFGSIRTAIIDNQLWFVGKDVAQALGYSNVSKAVSTHCKHIRKIMMDTNMDVNVYAGSQNGNVVKTQTSLISEGDIYRLIIRSKLPSAERFESWIFDEVLPSIRKNNAYSVSFSDKDILLKAVDIVDVKIKEKKDELNKLEQSRSVFNILID